ncbi:MAG: hypothetical protein QOH01_2844 [Verrucomicrobiota bacterium]|jgi:hypothetical protein
MKTVILRIVSCLSLVGSLAYGAIPSVNVTVADSSGKTTSKGVTNAKGTFATGALKPGAYVVQFNSATASSSGRYAFIVSAGKKSMTANGIPAEKLAKGGVAMKIDVGAGLNITAQVTAEDKNSAPMGTNGKLMVWIPKQIGSNIAAHWAESDSAEAKQAQTSGSYSAKNIQDKQSAGKSPDQVGDGNSKLFHP